MPHYWIVDPEHATVTVYRWHRDGYVAAHTASRGEQAALDPFPEVELAIGRLFGDDA